MNRTPPSQCWQRVVALLLLPLLLPLLPACSSVSPLAPVDPPAPLQHFEPSLTVTPLWSRTIGSDSEDLRLAPLLDGEQIYVASGSRVAALNRADGTTLWQVTLPQPISTPPADGDELLLLGGDAEVIALRKADGSVAWRSGVSSEVLAAPRLAAGRVLVHTLDGYLLALDHFDGSEVWRFSQPVPALSLRGSSRPAATADVAVAGFANGRVAALALSDGTPRWLTAAATAHGRSELERLVDVDAELVVAGGAVFASSYPARTVALTLSGGEPFWERDIGSHSALALADATLYLSDSRGDVWALEARSGATLWKQAALHGRDLGAPAIQADAVVVGDGSGYLHWLSREDGRLIARHAIGDAALPTAAAVAADQLYLFAADGQLSALQVAPR